MWPLRTNWYRREVSMTFPGQITGHHDLERTQNGLPGGKTLPPSNIIHERIFFLANAAILIYQKSLYQLSLAIIKEPKEPNPTSVLHPCYHLHPLSSLASYPSFITRNYCLAIESHYSGSNEWWGIIVHEGKPLSSLEWLNVINS